MFRFQKIGRERSVWGRGIAGMGQGINGRERGCEGRGEQTSLDHGLDPERTYSI